MTREEAKDVFLNRGYVKVNGGEIFDGDKWRQSVVVISEWLKQEPCEDCISRAEVIQSRPEWLDENVERDTPEQTLIDREYSKGWNKCLQAFLDNIKQLPSVKPATK